MIDEEDQYGNLETGDNSTVVTASLASGTGPLKGTQTVTVSGGVATFTDLADDTAETITLEFTSGGLTSVTSTAITVTAGAAAQLAVTTAPPSSVEAGQGFGLVVSAEDKYGNLATTYNGDVTLNEQRRRGHAGRDHDRRSRRRGSDLFRPDAEQHRQRAYSSRLRQRTYFRHDDVLQHHSHTDNHSHSHTEPDSNVHAAADDQQRAS